jgi:hypothetical protein
LINNDEIMLPNGVNYTRKCVSELAGTEVANGTYSVCEMLNELELTDAEKVLMFLLVLTNYSKLF